MQSIYVQNARTLQGYERFVYVVVGLAGIEPATFRPPDGRATRLRHSPNMACSYRINVAVQEAIAPTLMGFRN